MSSWTLLSPPAWRSKDNTRPGIVAPASTSSETHPSLSADPSVLQQKLQGQPPLFLLISRTGPVTVQLNDAITNEVMYKIHETGRSRFSSKPDYEVFRASAGDLLVGSVRFGRQGVEMRLPVVDRKIDDMREFESCGGKKLCWMIEHIGRRKSSDQMSEEAAEESGRWIAVLDCHDKALDHGQSGQQELICAVKLYDTLPNGRFEIWDKGACVNVGGDWTFLDELVTVSFANMEVARRKIMNGPDPATPFLPGIGTGIVLSGIGS